MEPVQHKGYYPVYKIKSPEYHTFYFGVSDICQHKLLNIIACFT